MGELKRELTFKDGLPLALGSIIGSGILFLPSLTYSIAHHDVGLVWVVATLLCIPLLVIFQATLARVPNESGIEGFISLGLGRHVGAGIPLLFLGTVCLGMPAAALIVGEYFQTYLHCNAMVVPAIALIITWVGALINIQKIKFSSRLQYVISALLFGLAIFLFGFTFSKALPNYTVLIPTFNFGETIGGMTVAFWAYAGFENLTFMAGEFKNPKRDLTLSILVALILSGLVYLGLTANYAALVAPEKIQEHLGLLQLARASAHPRVLSIVVIGVAYVAVQFNFNSWIWGISRLIYSSAQKGLLPLYFGKINHNEVPARAVIGLAVLFTVNILIGAMNPEIVRTAVLLASTNFVAIYAFAVLSFIFVERNLILRAVSSIVMGVFLAAAFRSGILILYPIGLVLCGAFVSQRSANGRVAL